MMNVNIESFNEIFENEHVKESIRKYQESSRPIDLSGFNVFEIISDQYHKENFHSDILAELLKLENQKFLKSFIEHLNKIQQEQQETCKEILWTNFEIGSNISREEGRIDIAIKNQQSKSVIIIENKINGAEDAERQLPRYFKFYEKQDYKKIYVVYLPIDRNKKKPNEYGWTKEDKTKVYKNFMTLFAYNQTELDLFSWIRSCIVQIEKIDILSTFRQYAKLIQIKGQEMIQNMIDMTSVKDFYEKSAKDKDLKDLLSFRDMLHLLPKFFAEKIKEDLLQKDYVKAKSYPVGTWELKDKPLNAICTHLQFNNKSKFQLDIYLSVQTEYFDHFNLSLFPRDWSNTNSYLNEIQKAGLVWQENWLGKRFYQWMHFKPTMEESFKELYKFLDDFIPKIQALIEKNDK